MPFAADQIPLFLAVLDAGSFSAAARKLGRVPSAVSMAIAQLEAELDLQLFDRRGREPVPTAAARALEPQARLLAEQLQQLNWQAQALHEGLEERLTLAIAPELFVRQGDAQSYGEIAKLQAEVISKVPDAQVLADLGEVQPGQSVAADRRAGLALAVLPSSGLRASARISTSPFLSPAKWPRRLARVAPRGRQHSRAPQV